MGCLKKADIPLTRRAGELNEEEVEKLVTIMQNPRQYKIPDWFLNRQRDIKDGKTTQVMANILDNKLREDLERLKKDPLSSWSPSLLGTQNPWSAHQEEINCLQMISLINCSVAKK